MSSQGQQESAPSGGLERQQAPTEAVEPSEENIEEAARMAQVYEDRPTAVLPGSGGTVSGVAVADWLDEEGNPKFGSIEENRQDAAGEQQAPPD